MIVAGSASPLLLSSAGGYNLTNSLRFRSSASAYLNRTPASASNRKTFTWSGWIKRGSLGASRRNMISAGTWSSGNLISAIAFDNSTADALYVFCDIFGTGNQWQLRTTQVFRDPSAWYHIVVAIDTTQATSSNRVKIYVNGTQVTAFSTATYPSLNFDNPINNNVVHQIGASTAGEYFDGYQAEVNFIDGQALTPSSFGETSATTGVWIPKKYTGTYGTNGFYLPFTDNSALTTSSNAGLGKDFSGNSNYWTTNNISITSGSTYDSMTDVPTLTSATVSNFATWSPLVLFPNTTYQASMTNANLLMTRSGGGQGGAVTTIGVTSGKFYAEMTVTAVGSSVTKLGVVSSNNPPSMNSGSEYDLGGTSVPASIAYRSNGARLTNGTTTNSWGSTYTTGDVIGVAFDADTGKIWFAKNGTWQASGDPAAGTNPATTVATGAPFYFSAGGESGISISLNCGQRPFAYTPPTGFVRLNTFNLPTPTIGATASTTANKYFDATLYTGNGTSVTVTNGGAMQPDWVWLKSRSSADQHNLIDVVRGAGNRLRTETTGAEEATPGTFTFNSNGFTSTTSNASFNGNGTTYVAWQWDAGGSGSTNTNGSINSTVSANTTAGFSVVTYTGNGTNGSTVGHGLGATPSMIIVKSRSTTGNWITYHTSTGINQYLYLNSTNASSTTSPTWGVSSTTFTLQQAFSDYNTNGTTYVAYCFAQVAGYSAFGSYTGNGSTDGPFIYTGFRPRFFMTKCTSSTGDWHMTDTARYPTNSSTSMGYLDANTSAAEGNFNIYDGLSNGFKIRDNGSVVNGSGATYIYMAFCESPFKFSNAR